MTLTLQNVTIKIGNTPICDQLNCAFLPGETWGIIGKNGSGKTRMLHTLANLFPPSSGTILLNQQPLHGYSKRHLATHIGLLAQENETSFPFTVFDAVTIGRYPHRHKEEHHIHNTLRALSLEHLSSRLISSLSGGEKQRTHIATLLAQAPNIYLLDEPLNHLDMGFRLRVLNHFQMLAKTQHAVVIMVLHDMHVVHEFCDKILMLQDNNVVNLYKTSDITTGEILSFFE